MKYKVGDMVAVVDDVLGHGIALGTLVIVEVLIPEESAYWCKIGTGNNFYFFEKELADANVAKKEETISINKESGISKEKILEKHIISGKEDSYGYGSSLDIVVSPPQNIYAAMQEYADLQTAAKDKEIAELVKTLKKIKDECLDMKSWKLCKKALRRHIL